MITSGGTVTSQLFRALSLCGGPVPRSIFVMVGALRLLRSGQHSEAMFLGATVGGTGAVNALIKRIVRRRRPLQLPPRRKAEHDSFPSGHTSGTFALTGATAYLLWRRSTDLPSAFAGILVSTALSSVMGYSRIQLRRHHPGDVVGGTVLGLAGLATGISAFRRLTGQPGSER